MIPEQLLVTGMAVCCYLVSDEKTRKGILIDPAGDHDGEFIFYLTFLRAEISPEGHRHDAP